MSDEDQWRHELVETLRALTIAVRNLKPTPTGPKLAREIHRFEPSDNSLTWRYQSNQLQRMRELVVVSWRPGRSTLSLYIDNEVVLSRVPVLLFTQDSYVTRRDSGTPAPYRFRTLLIGQSARLQVETDGDVSILEVYAEFEVPPPTMNPPIRLPSRSRGYDPVLGFDDIEDEI